MTVAVIATQVLGDLVNFVRGDFLRGGVGFGIAAALLFYLLRPEVKAVFNQALTADGRAWPTSKSMRSNAGLDWNLRTVALIYNRVSESRNFFRG